VFLTKEQLGRRYPEVPLSPLPERGCAGLVIAADLAATETALGILGIRSGRAICVSPASGNGTLLVFVSA
jgi:hypothetical protein